MHNNLSTSYIFFSFLFFCVRCQIQSFIFVSSSKQKREERRTIINGLFSLSLSSSPIVYITQPLSLSCCLRFVCCISENLASHGAGHISNKYEIQYPHSRWRANVVSDIECSTMESIVIDEYRSARSRSARSDDRQITAMYYDFSSYDVRKQNDLIDW